MTAKDILSNVYYGTIRQIAEDLIKQIEDHESFFSKSKEKEDDFEIERINIGINKRNNISLLW
jgi:hypothetical protein